MSEMLERIGNSTVIMCDGVVRWVSLSPMQAHERKLQQRFTTTTFENGKPVSRNEEWRDVPFVNE